MVAGQAYPADRLSGYPAGQSLNLLPGLPIITSSK